MGRRDRRRGGEGSFVVEYSSGGMTQPNGPMPSENDAKYNAKLPITV